MPDKSPPSFSYYFGQDADWKSPLLDVQIHVELPFFLFVPPGSLRVRYRGEQFSVYICPPYKETFLGEVRDSKLSRLHLGPAGEQRRAWNKPEREFITENGGVVLDRSCKAVVRFDAKCHRYFLLPPPENSLARSWAEQEAYRASLAEAYLPVLNELVQRYRLVTYDFFAYELSPWDVPVWTITSNETGGWLAHLVPYVTFDVPPVLVDANNSNPTAILYGDLTELEQMNSADAGAGEFELLDARSSMERGDYTGAIRRTVTAIEAVVRYALLEELKRSYVEGEALDRLSKTDNDFPGRLRQWAKLSRTEISDSEWARIKDVRSWRHDIVHRGSRVSFEQVGQAQYFIDTMRWFYNKVENDEVRAQLRDTNILKSFGRRALSSRFKTALSNGAFIVQEPEGFGTQADESD